MQRQIRLNLILLFLVTVAAGCGGDDAAGRGDRHTEPQPPGISEVATEHAAPNSRNQAGPKFCGKIRPAVIEAAFEFKLKLADVSVAEEFECHYNLDAPGTDMALLIYRMQSVVMYDAFKDSTSHGETEVISGLGEEAILVGNAQINVRLDRERAFTVALQIISSMGEPLPITEAEIKAGLTRFARLLSARL